MAKFIPVEPEKWAEMVKAAASSDYWRIEAETDHARWLRTLEENEKLRAEVERLTFDPMTYLDDKGEWMPRHIHLAAVERLKAEVENSNRINTELLLLSNQQASEVRRLKAEVERLTKLCQATSPDGFIHIRDINAAKEGKQS